MLTNYHEISSHELSLMYFTEKEILYSPDKQAQCLGNFRHLDKKLGGLHTNFFIMVQ